MSNLDVRIVNLEPMHVAAAYGFGTNPEEQAWNKLLAWLKAKGIDAKAQRFFGFNNPSPTAASPNYGYDVWVTVGPDFSPAGDGQVLTFPGGLYAVTRIHPISGEEIPAAWQSLVAWREASRYRPATHQWLEEHIGDIRLSFPELDLDLYLPIAE